ncbi:MAG: DNA adenine methylase [Bacteroidales bacterium]|nr:DNA adenine methylase [Bacteroidales bacterium]
MNGLTPHIVQYQGSKRLLAPQILPYLPGNFSRLVEPFAGMAAITIAVAKNEMSDSFVVNDINDALVGILKQAINAPNKLYEEYVDVWSAQFNYPEGHVAHFYKIRDEYNAGDSAPAKMLYLLARCVKGSVRYGSNGKFNQSPDKRRNGTSPKTLKQNIDAISYYLKGRTAFYSLDYREILNRTHKGDIVYMDPPYQGTSNVRDSRYISGLDYEEFVESIDRLNAKGIDFLISYDGSCGDKQYGRELPPELGLKKVMLNAGLSSQSLLLGKKETTYEALYISRGLQANIPSEKVSHKKQMQYSLFDAVAV